ncbi:nucleotide exchange factor GrpE [Hyphomonas sp.]|uniref:nucleotide exchange factor GrpE n=1 Tax=Hyphomonas sp. TaxID=87 RepID=UPI003340622D
MSDTSNTGDAADLETPPEAAEAQAPAPPPEEVIAKLEAEKEELRMQYVRLYADLDNTRKRADREVSEARVYAIGKFAGDLLNVADNLARALSALPDAGRDTLTEAGKNLLGGIEMTQKELHTVFTRHNVLPIEAEPGGTFDPNVHQAVAQIPSPHPAGTIAQLFQPGWRIGERTLRAAMVAVSLGQAN